MTNTIIITRHQGLIDYILEKGIAPPGTPVIPHAGEEDVRGNRCIGPLPLRLAAIADSVVDIPLHLPPDMRGVELTKEQAAQYAGEPVEYFVGFATMADSL